MTSLFQNKIKIFLDGAERAHMIEALKNPLVKGFTTNPSLMKKAGVKDYKAAAFDLLKEIPNHPISFEVFADDFPEMKRQAGEIKAWGANVYVKIPVMNSKGESSMPLVRELSQSGVKLNVTAIFTAKQVLDTCKALEGGAPSIVSVFAGRIADSGVDPMPLMFASSEICKAHGKQIELLWASTREFYNIIQAEQSGCEIITAPLDVIKKFSMQGKSPMDLSFDTIKTFKADSEAAGFKL